MNRRRRIKKKKDLDELYKEKIFFPYISTKDVNNNIAFIVPTTSNKRNYQKCEDMDFFAILYDSFLKTVKRKNYSYSFYFASPTFNYRF